MKSGIGKGNQTVPEKFSLDDGGRRVTSIFGKHWLYPIQLTRAIVVVDAKGIIRTKQITLRAFRLSDSKILRHTYAAREDALHDTFTTIVSQADSKLDEE